MAASSTSSATKSLSQKALGDNGTMFRPGIQVSHTQSTRVPGRLPRHIQDYATSDPETVFDKKYYTRDQRRNRPPILRAILNKANIEKMTKEKTFDFWDFPRVYLTDRVEADDARGGGYQK